MFIPWLALPVALQLIAVADGVPKLDVRPSCKGAAQAGYLRTTEERMKSCIDSEQRTRDELSKNWSSFPASARMFCLEGIKGFEPTYTELATCLEMSRDLANAKANEKTRDPMPLRTRARR